MCVCCRTSVGPSFFHTHGVRGMNCRSSLRKYHRMAKNRPSSGTGIVSCPFHIRAPFSSAFRQVRYRRGTGILYEYNFTHDKCHISTACIVESCRLVQLQAISDLIREIAAVGTHWVVQQQYGGNPAILRKVLRHTRSESAAIMITPRFRLRHQGTARNKHREESLSSRT